MSASVNKVLIIGRVGKEPQRLNGGFDNKPCCRVLVATDDPGTNGTTITSWHNIICFGQPAKYVLDYVHKGALLLVEARIQYGKFTDKNGLDVYTTDIKAISVKQLSCPTDDTDLTN